MRGWDGVPAGLEVQCARAQPQHSVPFCSRTRCFLPHFEVFSILFILGINWSVSSPSLLLPRYIQLHMDFRVTLVYASYIYINGCLFVEEQQKSHKNKCSLHPTTATAAQGGGGSGQGAPGHPHAPAERTAVGTSGCCGYGRLPGAAVPAVGLLCCTQGPARGRLLLAPRSRSSAVPGGPSAAAPRGAASATNGSCQAAAWGGRGICWVLRGGWGGGEHLRRRKRKGREEA